MLVRFLNDSVFPIQNNNVESMCKSVFAPKTPKNLTKDIRKEVN